MIKSQQGKKDLIEGPFDEARREKSVAAKRRARLDNAITLEAPKILEKS